MTGEGRPGGVRTYRSIIGTVSMWASVLIALFLLGDAVLRVGWGRTLLVAPWILLALWIVYEISYVSAIRVDDDGVTVQNMLRRTSFGWGRVRDVELRWQTVFALADDTEVTSYGGPAQSRPRRPAKGEDPDVVREAAGPRDAAEIRQRFIDAAGHGTDAPIQRSWDTRALTVLVVILAWAVLAIIVNSMG